MIGGVAIPGVLTATLAASLVNRTTVAGQQVSDALDVAARVAGG